MMSQMQNPGGLMGGYLTGAKGASTGPALGGMGGMNFGNMNFGGMNLGQLANQYVPGMQQQQPQQPTGNIYANVAGTPLTPQGVQNVAAQQQRPPQPMPPQQSPQSTYNPAAQQGMLQRPVSPMAGINGPLGASSNPTSNSFGGSTQSQPQYRPPQMAQQTPTAPQSSRPNMGNAPGIALYSNPNFGINSLQNGQQSNRPQSWGAQNALPPQQQQQTWNSSLPGGGMGSAPALGGGIMGGYQTGRR